MENHNEKRNNYLGVIVAIIVILGGVASFQRPTNQRVDFMENRYDELVGRMDKLDDRERFADEKLASIQERFKEIETQFRGARELSDLRFVEAERRLGKQENDGNPRHDERIRHLEERIDNHSNHQKAH